MKNTTLCYITRGDQVLMLHRVKKEHDLNHDKWIGIGGKCEEGESPEEHSRRAVEGFKKILSETQGDVMVIAHNGSMTAFMQYLFPDEGENRWYWNSGNGEGFCVEFDGGRPSWYKRIPE